MSTARDMLALLRRHYISDEQRPAGIFAPEIAAPHGNRRADLIFQGCTAATGSALVGHEIKVTRADLLAELADLTKSDPWQRYCDRWYLVVPSLDLIDGLDLPDSWGVMTPPSGRRTRSMTITTKAPQLRPDDQTPALRTLATWLHWRGHRAHTALAQAQDARQRAEERARDAEARAPRGDDQQSRQHQIVDEIVRRLGGPDRGDGDRIGRYPDTVKVDDVVQALTDLKATKDRVRMDLYPLENAARELARLLHDVDRGAVSRLAGQLSEQRATAS